MTLKNALGAVALDETLAEVRDRIRDETGVPDLAAGTGGGTVSLPADALLLAVSVTAVGGDGTFTVDGKGPITCREDQGIDFNPAGWWTGPFDVVFSAELDYVVEWVA